MYKDRKSLSSRSPLIKSPLVKIKGRKSKAYKYEAACECCGGKSFATELTHAQHLFGEKHLERRRVQVKDLMTEFPFADIRRVLSSRVGRVATLPAPSRRQAGGTPTVRRAMVQLLTNCSPPHKTELGQSAESRNLTKGGR